MHGPFCSLSRIDSINPSFPFSPFPFFHSPLKIKPGQARFPDAEASGRGQDASLCRHPSFYDHPNSSGQLIRVAQQQLNQTPFFDDSFFDGLAGHFMREDTDLR